MQAALIPCDETALLCRTGYDQFRQHCTLSRQRLGHASNTNRAAASRDRSGWLSPRPPAQRAVDGAYRFSSDRQRIRESHDCVDQGATAARRDRLHRRPGAIGHAQFRGCPDRGHPGRRPAHHRQQRGRAIFRQQAHHRISEGVDRRDGRDAAPDGTRCRRHRSLRHHLGLSGAGRDHGANGARGSARQPQAADRSRLLRPSTAAASTRCGARREFSPGSSACPNTCR